MSELDQAVDNYETKRLRYRLLSEANTHGLSAEESIEQSRAYHRADVEMRQAWGHLEEVKARLATEKPQHG
jgi:hypothetical protein